MKNILIILVVLVAVFAAAYYVFHRPQPIWILTQIPPPSPAAIPAAPSISDWKTCNYPYYGISFRYPPYWNVYAYPSSAGGGYPFETICGAVDARALNPGITVASSSDWDGPSGGMHIVFITQNSDQLLKNSTTTLGGRPSYGNGNSILAGGYEIDFGKDTPTSTRDAVLKSFEFVTVSSTTNN